jgi:hypothetical protein
MTPDKRRQYNRNQAKRYAEDPEYRARCNARSKEYDRTHREQISAQHRTRRETDPAYKAKILAKGRIHGRRYTLKWKYGLSLEDYDAMVERQGGVCLFCDRPTEAPLYVDHCHVTNLVRALLCRGCNAGIGHFGENPVVMRRSALFVELWLQHIFELCNKENTDMICNEGTSDESATAKVIAKPMRDAILHELNQPLGADPPAPRNRLQTVARALLSKAEAQDMRAIEEVLDRIDGPVQLANPFNVSWPTVLEKLKSRRQSTSTEKEAKADATRENEASPSGANRGSLSISSRKRTASRSRP